MKTSSRRKLIAARIFVRSWPAWPTNGSPVASSFAPGASPTQTSSAFGLPSPGTGFVAVAYSRHLVHTLIAPAISSIDATFVSPGANRSRAAVPTIRPGGAIGAAGRSAGGRAAGALAGPADSGGCGRDDGSGASRGGTSAGAGNSYRFETGGA